MLFGVSKRAPEEMRMKAIILSNWGCQLRNRFEEQIDPDYDDSCPQNMDCTDCKLQYWNKVQGTSMATLYSLVFSFEEENEDDDDD